MDVNEYERIVNAMFSDGVFNKGRVLVLFSLAKIISEWLPSEADRIWEVYLDTIKDKGFSSDEEKGRVQMESRKQPIRMQSVQPIRKQM